MQNLSKEKEIIEVVALSFSLLQNLGLFSKGESLRMLNRYQEALEYLNQALSIDNNHADSLGQKGACLIGMGKFNEAEQYLNKAIKLQRNKQWNKNQICNVKIYSQETLKDNQTKQNQKLI